MNISIFSSFCAFLPVYFSEKDMFDIWYVYILYVNNLKMLQKNHKKSHLMVSYIDKNKIKAKITDPFLHKGKDKIQVLFFVY